MVRVVVRVVVVTTLQCFEDSTELAEMSHCVSVVFWDRDRKVG